MSLIGIAGIHLLATLRDRDYHLHFTDKNTKAQKGEVTGLRCSGDSKSSPSSEPGFIRTKQCHLLPMKLAGPREDGGEYLELFFPPSPATGQGNPTQSHLNRAG